MFQKAIFILSLAALMPFHSAGAQPQMDPELIEMENLLDQQAEELLNPQVIATLAALNEQGAFAKSPFSPVVRRPRRPRPPGFGRHPRRVQCVARNSRGQRFAADGYVQWRVSRRALRSCRRFSRGPRVKRSCRVIHCRWVR